MHMIYDWKFVMGQKAYPITQTQELAFCLQMGETENPSMKTEKNVLEISKNGPNKSWVCTHDLFA